MHMGMEDPTWGFSEQGSILGNVVGFRGCRMEDQNFSMQRRPPLIYEHRQTSGNAELRSERAQALLQATARMISTTREAFGFLVSKEDRNLSPFPLVDTLSDSRAAALNIKSFQWSGLVPFILACTADKDWIVPLPMTDHRSGAAREDKDLFLGYSTDIASLGGAYIMAIGNIYAIAAIAVIGGGLFGFDISSMSAIIGTDQYKRYFNQGPAGQPPTGPRSDVQGGITAAMPGGSWLGALISGPVSDTFGRKKAIMLGCIIWVIGSIITSAAQNIGMLIVGRLVNGFCVGICSAQVPVYISELATPSIRGRLVGAQQWAITWGIMIMFYISYGCSFINGTASFRVPWGLQMIPAIGLFFGCLFLPESPRWLASKDRWEEAHQVLTLVHSKNDPDAPLVRQELRQIREMVEFERANADVSYLELFKPSMINRTHIGVFTQIWSQLTGMNVMMYYITYVFAMAGLSGNNLLVSSSIQYVINVIMTIPGLILLDIAGRRPLLLVGALLMMTWLFANGGILKSYGHYAGPRGADGKTPEASWSVSGPASKAVIACSYLFVASFAPTWGPVSWVYPPELYPLRVRGKAVALATSANWAFNFALGYFVPPAFVNIKYQTYFVFAVFCFAMFVHAFFMFPETAGKTLEETEAMFTDPHGPKYIGQLAWTTRTQREQILKLEHGEVDPEKSKAFDESPERKSGIS